MSKQQTSENHVVLIGDVKERLTLTDCNLPSNGQMLAVLFYNLRVRKLNLNDSAHRVVRDCVQFWNGARIPTKALCNCVRKLTKLYELWRNVQKSRLRNASSATRQRQKEFSESLNNLFDIAHADALKRMTIEEDKIFLQQQRRLFRTDRVDEGDVEEENLDLCDPLEDSSNYDAIQNSMSALKTLKKAMKKDLITPKLIATLDQCRLSADNSVLIIRAVVEALGLNADEYLINKSCIKRMRTNKKTNSKRKRTE